MLTVRALLDDLGVQVLAGEDGIDLPVRWVHMSELPDPTPWLSGGEVLLTTGLQLTDAHAQVAFVERLVDRRLAALGFGTGFGHEAVPAAIVAAAEENGFPVFEVPYELPFIAVTEMAAVQIVNEQYAVLRRALSAQERLERIVLSERGPDALAGTLATLVGGTIMLLDGKGEEIVRHAFRRTLEPPVVDAVVAGVRARLERGEHRAFVPEVEEPSRALALPVGADGVPSGAATVPDAWLVVVKDTEPLSDFDRLTLRQAVTIVALELLRERVAGDTERRLAGDILSALLDGELQGGELRRRLTPFGIDGRAAVLVLARPAASGGSAAGAEAALGVALRAESSRGLVATAGQLVCAIVPGEDDEPLFALAERVAHRLAPELDEPVRLGVGRALPVEAARRSFHEARCTLEALSLGLDRPRGSGANGNGHGRSGEHGGLRATMEEPRVVTYRDLGSFQLLLSLQDDEALKLYCDSILGAIEGSEGDYGGELMRSLEAFIEENGQWERAAARLPCHRHTLRYRIRRVEELTGRDLSSARDRIEFWLALRGRELVA